MVVPWKVPGPSRRHPPAGTGFPPCPFPACFHSCYQRAVPTMKFQKSYRVIPLVLAVLFCTGDFLHSEEAAPKKRTPSETMTLPKPAEVLSLSIYPTKIVLKGRDDARQLICTAELSGGRLQDLSGDVRYVVADATVVQVTRSGRVLPRANGSTSITAHYGN